MILTFVQGAFKKLSWPQGVYIFSATGYIGNVDFTMPTRSSQAVYFRRFQFAPPLLSPPTEESHLPGCPKKAEISTGSGL